MRKQRYVVLHRLLYLRLFIALNRRSKAQVIWTTIHLLLNVKCSDFSNFAYVYCSKLTDIRCKTIRLSWLFCSLFLLEILRNPTKTRCRNTTSIERRSIYIHFKCYRLWLHFRVPECHSPEKYWNWHTYQYRDVKCCRY